MKLTNSRKLLIIMHKNTLTEEHLRPLIQFVLLLRSILAQSYAILSCKPRVDSRSKPLRSFCPTVTHFYRAAWNADAV